jgi:hypothetical protein
MHLFMAHELTTGAKWAVNKADGMDDAVADKMEVLRKKDGPSRAKIKSIWLSVLHV